jgi:hypothetical protein
MTDPAPDFAAYHAALIAHQEEEVRWAVQVRPLVTLVATLQFALRAPTYPDLLRGTIEGFLEAAIDRLYRIDPTIGYVAEAGMDPGWDEPALAEEEHDDLFLFRQGQPVRWAEVPEERLVVVERRWTQREILGPFAEYHLRTQLDSNTLGQVMTPWVSEADLEARKE